MQVRFVDAENKGYIWGTTLDLHEISLAVGQRIRMRTKDSEPWSFYEIKGIYHDFTTFTGGYQLTVQLDRVAPFGQADGT
ncbi:hypothetical protein [Nannocystis radixulma]|uniref:Uncharacterized protein n=1 Tax=Nannocystis radixulma TaxID=2995305 RepID=A0ABT5BEX9_9BACT|nr:hypothetical protein [Nannocystis radixulma]MDC0672273.1 hypothetical protein [Nannocystis radixulma]